MIYDVEFIEKLPVDKVQAAKVMCDAFINFEKQLHPSKRIDYYTDYIYSYAALEAFIESRGFEQKLSSLSISNKKTNIEVVQREFSIFRGKIEQFLDADKIESAKIKYQELFKTGFIYEFTDGDLERVQTLINELRSEIQKSELMVATHKERLLKKLEGMQNELHKTVSTLDKFWGVVGDAGIVMGKFGKDAKPLVDRFREIAEIVWRTQAKAEELPSGITMPLLGSGDE